MLIILLFFLSITFSDDEVTNTDTLNQKKQEYEEIEQVNSDNIDMTKNQETESKSTNRNSLFFTNVELKSQKQKFQKYLVLKAIISNEKTYSIWINDKKITVVHNQFDQVFLVNEVQFKISEVHREHIIISLNDSKSIELKIHVPIYITTEEQD